MFCFNGFGVIVALVVSCLPVPWLCLISVVGLGCVWANVQFVRRCIYGLVACSCGGFAYCWFDYGLCWSGLLLGFGFVCDLLCCLGVYCRLSFVWGCFRLVSIVAGGWWLVMVLVVGFGCSLGVLWSGWLSIVLCGFICFGLRAVSLRVLLVWGGVVRWWFAVV